MSLLLSEFPNFTWLAKLRLPGLEKVVLDRDILSLAGCAMVAFMMLACVAGWLVRMSRLRRAAKADAKFTAAFRSSAHALALFQNAESVEGSPRSALYTNASRELCFHLLGTDAVDQSFPMRLRAAGRIVSTQWQATQRAARRSIDESRRWLQGGLTGAGVKALLGLGALGTLLSLMERASNGTLDAASAASSLKPLVLALACHVIGVSWHSRVQRRASEAVENLEEFSTELGTIFERNYVDHRQPIEVLPSLGGMGIADGPTFSVPPAEPSRKRVG